MQLGQPTDPALEAASLALTGREAPGSSRFASIELRQSGRDLSQLAPLGYAASALAGAIVVAVLWIM